MSIPAPPMPWSALPPDEKLRRLKLTFINGRITIEEFEDQLEEVLIEQDEWDRHGLTLRDPGKRTRL